MSEVITGVVGGVVGFFVGGPQGAVYGAQLGYAAGSALFAEETVVQGQQVGELAAQTSREGVPRPIVFGTARPIGGNIIATTKPIIRINRERVGSGKQKQTVESEEIFRTYAIRICEGPVAGVRRVWRNGTLVYFAGSDDATQIQNNQEFLKIATFYLGDFEQEPDPNLQAIFGADNVVAHRGTCYMVIYDENLTQLGGAIPQYQFEVGQVAGHPITDAYMWFDAADPAYLVLNGDRVEQWLDKTGNGRNHVQAVESSQPLMVSNGVQFDNQGDEQATVPADTKYLQRVSAENPETDDPFTLFAVVDSVVNAPVSEMIDYPARLETFGFGWSDTCGIVPGDPKNFANFGTAFQYLLNCMSGPGQLQWLPGDEFYQNKLNYVYNANDQTLLANGILWEDSVARFAISFPSEVPSEIPYPIGPAWNASRGSILSMAGSDDPGINSYSASLSFWGAAYTRSSQAATTFAEAGGSADWGESARNLVTSIWASSTDRRVEVNASGSIATDETPITVGDRNVSFIGIERTPSVSSPSFALSGIVREIILYKRLLEPEEKAAVEDYLMTKWSIS